MTNQQTTTTDGQTATLVLKDSAGSYYLLPLETLEQGRVPAERAAEIEGLIAAATEGGAGEEDTKGYFPIWPIFVLPGVAAAAIHIAARIEQSGSQSGSAGSHWSYFDEAYRSALQ